MALESLTLNTTDLPLIDDATTSPSCLPSPYSYSGSPAIIKVRSCDYCKTTHTPLWRSGPKTCKSLCNSCGISWSRGKILSSQDQDGGYQIISKRSKGPKSRGLKKKVKQEESTPSRINSNRNDQLQTPALSITSVEATTGTSDHTKLVSDFAELLEKLNETNTIMFFAILSDSLMPIISDAYLSGKKVELNISDITPLTWAALRGVFPNLQ